MAEQVTAIYEDGVLKPLVPLNLAEHQRVRITVSTDFPETNQLADKQRAAMEQLDAELAGIPDHSPDDGFTSADHDKILYGGSA